jgi:hypothetical protein
VLVDSSVGSIGADVDVASVETGAVDVFDTTGAEEEDSSVADTGAEVDDSFEANGAAVPGADVDSVDSVATGEDVDASSFPRTDDGEADLA